MAKVIGIDLGTTNSVAAIKKVHTEIIKNVEGELITPSCVNIQKGKSATTRFVVGRDALEWLKQDPENTITAIKRLIGRSYNEPEVDHLLKDHRLAYKVSKNSKGSENSLVIQANGQEYTAEEISAKILTKIKRDTEKNEGSKVEFAVITVPAYFNDKQKHATRIAAAQAGLKVQRLLPEPTAAAISFGVDQIKDDEAKVVLVFDFGGGTLDLSVLTISGGQFIEQGKGGDMWLGGDDIDRLLSDYVLSATAEEYGIENIENLLSQTETRKRNQFLTELKSTVEQAKIKLSSKDSAWVEILGLLRDQDGDSIDIEVELTRDRLDELLQPIVASIIKMADDVIESIHFSPDLIDQVLLVGGSSKIPLIVTAMREKFGVEKVVIHDRPMLAIAEGAAILSHRLADNYECPECGQAVDQGDTNCPKCHFDLERYTIDHGIFDIVHSAAHDYYIQLTDNQRHLLIEKNTPLPCVINETFKFVSLDQKMVHLNFFNVVNGEEQWVGDLWLGIDNKELEKENCNFSEENPLQVELCITIDENNLVEVNAGIKNLPAATLSKTLSRGSADEKLFISLEDLINQANSRGYSTFVSADLEERAISIIKTIDGVVAQDTGIVDEKLYTLATMKIDKADRIAADGDAPYCSIYYTRDLIESFDMAIPDKLHKQLEKSIDKLLATEESGSYEETTKAHQELSKLLQSAGLGFAKLLVNIQNAGQLCAEKGDPSQAAKFMTAIGDILRAVEDDNEEKAHTVVREIMPEVNALLDEEGEKAQEIFKDITR